jgi:hypothetical protein
MVAAQYFNGQRGNKIDVIYGSVTSGNRWIFLKLEDQTLSLDLEAYTIPPINLFAWHIGLDNPGLVCDCDLA